MIYRYPASQNDEERRLATLHALALRDVDAADEFDSLVALAAEMLDCPLAALTLVDRDRQWIKAKVGDLADGLPRDMAFCDHTIRGGDAMVVEDAAADPRFAANPLVTGGSIGFYAGMPIHAADDRGVAQPIGALCVIDDAPRSLSPAGHRTLAHLANLAEALIAARGAAIRALAVAELSERQDRTFRQAERMAAIGSWRLGLPDHDIDWSDGVFQIYGLTPDTMPPIDRALSAYPPDARAVITAALDRCIATGEPFDVEVDFVTADRRRRRVRSMGERQQVDGVPAAIIGVVQDVTDRYRLEQALRRSAETDPLTGLPNRVGFEHTLTAAIAGAQRTGKPLMLALLDLDGFKAINDTLGHLAGDDVLKTVARTLREAWLAGSAPARLGGDEFALVIEHPALLADPRSLVARLEAELRQPVTSIQGLTMASAGTVGLAMLEPGMELRDLVHAADVVLYAAKRRRVGEGLIPERRRAA